MSKTYLQVLKQIEDLKTQAEKLRRGEVEGVVKRIRDQIARYGLTPADLGFTGAAAAPSSRRGRKPGRPAKASSRAGSKVAPKFRDENGNTWAGRGKRPVWLRDALAAGHKLEEFAIK